jgi:hypothetical protein
MYSPPSLSLPSIPLCLDCALFINIKKKNFKAGDLLSDYRDLVGFCESLLVEREEARRLYIEHLKKDKN